MGDLIDFQSAREDREDAELMALQLRVEAALANIGPVTSGPMWLDEETGDLVLLVEIEMSKL